jgi:hypothetical protein
MRRRHGAVLPPMSALIFDLIESSGSRGVTPEVLAELFFPDSINGRRLAYVHANRLNDFLEPTPFCVRIRSRGGAYVVKRKNVRAAA